MGLDRAFDQKRDNATRRKRERSNLSREIRGAEILSSCVEDGDCCSVDDSLRSNVLREPKEREREKSEEMGRKGEERGEDDLTAIASSGHLTVHCDSKGVHPVIGARIESRHKADRSKRSKEKGGGRRKGY